MILDEISFLITTPVNVLLGKLERDLNRGGYTLGYRPVSGNGLTLQRVLDRRIPNLYALKYGEIDDICVSLKVRKNGALIVTKNVPRAATGPDFKKIFIGSVGIYGEIQEATLRICPLPEKQERLGFSWKNPKQKNQFLKNIWASGIRPLRIRNDSPRSLTIEIEGSGEIFRAEKKCLKRYVREIKVSFRNER